MRVSHHDIRIFSLNHLHQFLQIPKNLPAMGAYKLARLYDAADTVVTSEKPAMKVPNRIF